MVDAYVTTKKVGCEMMLHLSNYRVDAGWQQYHGLGATASLADLWQARQQSPMRDGVWDDV